MTKEEREEAIKQLQGCIIAEEHGKDGKPNGNVTCELTKDILDMAIQALEQESIAQERYEDLCEYFGGAKDILKHREDFKEWLDRVKWHIHKAEELSAENDDLRDQLAMRDRFQKHCTLCKDCISRRDAINRFTYNYKGERIPDYDCDNFPVQIDIKTVKEILRELPPVNPQPCPNAISRSDMLDAIGHGMTYTSEELQKIIKALPSVNPLSKDYNTIYYTPKSKTGNWIKKEDDTCWWYACSECEQEPLKNRWNDDDVLSTFCPNCGAKMIEPQESEG